jgi:MinD-like ATPase involved in chromosome partitioning or flagellar assembly
VELPTYTSIWRIEKRLYKLYDFRLPMPLPVGQIAVFTAVTVPYVVLLTLFGLPFSHSLFWLYVLPPGLLTWLATRPVLESKRLPELLTSQARYLGEPSTWCRMAPLSEKDQVVVFGRVWRQVSAATAEVAQAEIASAEQDQAIVELPVTARPTLPVATPVARQIAAQADTADTVQARQARGRQARGRLVRQRQVPERPVPEEAPAGPPQDERVRQSAEPRESRWARAAGMPRRTPAPGRPDAPDAGRGPGPAGAPDSVRAPAQSGAPGQNGVPGQAAGAQGTAVGAGWARDVTAGTRRDPGPAGPVGQGRHAAPARSPAPGGPPAPGRPPVPGRPPAPVGYAAGGGTWRMAPGTNAPASDGKADGAPVTGDAAQYSRDSGAGGDAGTGWPMVGYGTIASAGPGDRVTGAGPGDPADAQPEEPAEGSGTQENYGPGQNADPYRNVGPGADEGARWSAGTGWPVGYPPNVSMWPVTQPGPVGPAPDPGAVPGPAVVRGPGQAGDARPAREADPAAGAPGGAGERPGIEGAAGTVPGAAAPGTSAPAASAPGRSEPAAAGLGSSGPTAAGPPIRVGRHAAAGPGTPAPARPGMPSATEPEALAPETAAPQAPAPQAPAPEVSALAAPAPQAPAQERPAQEPPAPQAPAPQAPAAEQPPPPAVPRRPPPVVIVPAQRSLAGLPKATPARPQPSPVERALSGPGERRATGWRGHVTVVPGGRGPGRPDHLKEARARAVLPLDRPRLVVVLGCTVGAGQTVTTLMLADLLAGLRGEPVAALDLNPGPASLTELARVPAITVSALLADRAPGAHAANGGNRSTGPIRGGGPSRGARTRGRLDVICQDAAPDGGVRLPNLQHHRLISVMASRYPLTFADPGASAVAKLLAEAGQLVLVAPASPDAAQAVSMTSEYLAGHGHAALTRRSIAVLNGVSQRSVRHAEQAEQVLRGRCRAIVRVPWDDHLAEPEAERGIRDSLETADGPPRLARLRPAVLQAYTALAGVLVSSLADDPVRRRAAR